MGKKKFLQNFNKKIKWFQKKSGGRNLRGFRNAKFKKLGEGGGI